MANADDGPEPDEPRKPADGDKSRDKAGDDKGGGDKAGGGKDDGDDKDEDDDDDGKSGGKKIVVFAIAGVVFLIALIVGLLWWLNARHYESTDDAFVDTHITHLAPQAAGQVRQVLVVDNQPVRAGQLLAQLDVSTADTQLAQAKGAEAQAQATIAQARAQVEVSAAQVAQAQANTLGPRAQLGFATRDFGRYLGVQAATPEAVARQQVDQAHTTQENDVANLAAAQQQVKTARAQLDAARTQLGAGQAQLETARAQASSAQVQIGYGRIVAPVDGHVANKTVAVGNYASAGQELMSVVPNAMWVTANFKETQLKSVHVGQHVDIKIDAYPKIVFPGHVESIQRGAGQSFAVLPAQNATGNYVKVVQRVPVKIVFDRIPDARHPIGPGMSVSPRVRID